MQYKEVEDRCCGYIVETFRFHKSGQLFNPLNTELNPICHLLALLGAHLILHVGRIRVNRLNIYQPIKESAAWCSGYAETVSVAYFKRKVQFTGFFF